MVSASLLTGGALPALKAAMTIPPFHLAFPVHDIEAAREFYIG